MRSLIGRRVRSRSGDTQFPLVGATLCALAWAAVFSSGCGGGSGGQTVTVSSSPDASTVYFPNYFASSNASYTAIGVDSHTVQFQTNSNTDSGFGTIGGAYSTGCDTGCDSGGTVDTGGSSDSSGTTGDSGGTTVDTGGSTGGSDGSATDGSTTDGSTTDGSNTGGSDTGGSDSSGTTGSDNSGTTGSSSSSTNSDSGGVAHKGRSRRKRSSMRSRMSNGDTVQEEVTFAQQVIWNGATGDLAHAKYGSLIFANYGSLDQTSGLTLSTSTVYDASGRPLALASLRTGLRILFDYPAPQKITLYVLDSNGNLVAASAGSYNPATGILSLSGLKIGSIIVPSSLAAINPFQTGPMADGPVVSACKGEPYYVNNGGCASDASFSNTQIKLMQSLALKTLGPSSWGHLLDNSLQFGNETQIQGAFGATPIDLAPLLNDASQGLGGTSYFSPGGPGVGFTHVPQTFAAPGRRRG